jgi:hypothetical protein
MLAIKLTSTKDARGNELLFIKRFPFLGSGYLVIVTGKEKQRKRDLSKRDGRVGKNGGCLIRGH